MLMEYKPASIIARRWEQSRDGSVPKSKKLARDIPNDAENAAYGTIDPKQCKVHVSEVPSERNGRT